MGGASAMDEDGEGEGFGWFGGAPQVVSGVGEGVETGDNLVG